MFSVRLKGVYNKGPRKNISVIVKVAQVDLVRLLVRSGFQQLQNTMELSVTEQKVRIFMFAVMLCECCSLVMSIKTWETSRHSSCS